MDRKKSCHIYTKLIVSGTSGGGSKIGRGGGVFTVRMYLRKTYVI